jgi:predicted DCC family thiol-disulfide oxidoreductase YuxK
MSRSTLIYDGDCPLCCRAAAWAEKHARRGALELLPCQDEDRARRFPAVTREQCLAAMQLVMADGRVYSGEEALPLLLDLMAGWHWLARILRFPGIRHASPAAYRWIASHRYAFSALAGRGRGAACGRNDAASHNESHNERNGCGQ